ncbi:MAG: Fic family protein [Nitriliruptoraceae bacterium]
MEITLTGSAYLTRLIADVARLAALIPKTVTQPSVDVLAQAALALEGVNTGTIPNLTEASALAQSRVNGALAVPDVRAGSWQDTLQLADPDPDATALLRAREVCGIAAADMLTFPNDRLLARMSALHVALTQNLVAPERQAQLRTFDVAVHDSGSGRIVYQPAKPADIAQQLTVLDAFYTAARVEALPHVVLAAIVLYGLQIIQPFDAANGRVGVLAARHTLREQFEGHYVPDVEPLLAADRGGFHDAIAQTVRRSDVTFWCERYAEAVVLALRSDVRAAGSIDTAPQLGQDLLVLLTQQETVTIRELPADDMLLMALLDAGMLVPITGMHGLKFVSQLARSNVV